MSILKFLLAVHFLNYVLGLYSNTGLQSITIISIKKTLLDLKYGGSSDVILPSFRLEKALRITA